MAPEMPPSRREVVGVAAAFRYGDGEQHYPEEIARDFNKTPKYSMGL